MLLIQQFTGTSFLWLLACLAMGLGYAYLLYQGKKPLNKLFRNSLFIFRTLAVTIIAYLLFAPPFKSTTKTTEKPLIILAQDNSASIALSKPSDYNSANYERDFKNLEKSLSRDYEVRSFSFGSKVQEGLNFGYNDKMSDLSSVYKMIDNNFANRNIGAVIIASDGIYNKGGNPVYENKNLKAPVFTVALGDTVSKKDLLIANINYNNIAYLDNQFQIEINLEAYQAIGLKSNLKITDQSGTLFSKAININSNEYRVNIPVSLLAKRKGIQRFNISLATVSDELSVQNNVQTIFVEVIDGRQKVLIIANAPHPDIAALRQSIEINKNYEVQVSFAESVTDSQIEKAGLIILHQLPSVNNAAQKILQQISEKPVLFMLGAQSNSSIFSTAQSVLNINSSGSTQEALPAVHPDFYAFTLTDVTKSKMQSFTPLIAPFGTYGQKGPASVALVQKIGNVVTTMPLLIFGGDGQRKVGVLAGEGLWRWWLEEFQETNNHEAVTELVSKTVQYLSVRDDKRKFRVYPSKNAFDENENVILNAELYNDAYELVNSPDVSVILKNRDGRSYSYLFSRTNNAYLLDASLLPAGEYSFDAKTRLGAKDHKASGQFVIREQQAEFQQTIANHQLLFSLAEQNGGQMVYPNQLQRLPELIKGNENVKTIVYEDRKYEEPVNYKRIFFLILALLSAEWFSRKRNGEV